MGDGAEAGAMGSTGSAGEMGPPAQMAGSNPWMANKSASSSKMEKAKAFLSDKDSMMMLANIGNSMLQGQRQLTPIGNGYYVRGGTRGAFRAGMNAAHESLSAEYMKAQKLEETLDAEGRRNAESDRRYKRGRKDQATDRASLRENILADRAESLSNKRTDLNESREFGAATLAESRDHAKVIRDEGRDYAEKKDAKAAKKALIRKQVKEHADGVTAYNNELEDFREVIRKAAVASLEHSVKLGQDPDVITRDQVNSDASSLSAIIAATKSARDNRIELENLYDAHQGQTLKAKQNSASMDDAIKRNVLMIQGGMQAAGPGADSPQVVIAQQEFEDKQNEATAKGKGLDARLVDTVTTQLKAMYVAKAKERGVEDVSMDFELKDAEKTRRNIALAENDQMPYDELYQRTFFDTAESASKIRFTTQDYIDKMIKRKR